LPLPELGLELRDESGHRRIDLLVIDLLMRRPERLRVVRRQSLEEVQCLCRPPMEPHAGSLRREPRWMEHLWMRVVRRPNYSGRVTEALDGAVQALARLSRLLERAAAPLSLADYRALAAILAGEERASRLAERLAVGKPSISATVD